MTRTHPALIILRVSWLPRRVSSINPLEVSMNGTLKCIVAAIAFTGGYIPAAYSQDGCKPVNGRFEAQVVPPGVGHCPNIPGVLCTAGRVWGGIQGQYKFVV